MTRNELIEASKLVAFLDSLGDTDDITSGSLVVMVPRTAEDGPPVNQIQRIIDAERAANGKKVTFNLPAVNVRRILEAERQLATTRLLELGVERNFPEGTDG